METFQWLRDVLTSPRGTPSNSRAVSPAPPAPWTLRKERDRSGERQSLATALPSASSSKSVVDVDAAATVPAACELTASLFPEEARSEIRQWSVVWPSGVNVRQTKHRSSQSLGTRELGSVVSGYEEDGWVALSAEPGFMLINDGRVNLLERKDVQPDLDAMMAAAEARRQEVETQATKLQELLAAAPGPSSQQCSKAGQTATARTTAPIMSVASSQQLAPDSGSAAIARFGTRNTMPNSDHETPALSYAEAQNPKVPDSPLLSAFPEPAMVLPPPTPLGQQYSPSAEAPEQVGSSQAVLSALSRPSPVVPSHRDGALVMHSNPLPPWRPTSSLRGRSGPPSPQQQARQLPSTADSRSPGPAADRHVRQRLEEAKGKVDYVMNDMSDVRSRLGAQEQRLSSLTRSLREISEGPPVSREAVKAGGIATQNNSNDEANRGTSPSLRPDVCTLFSSMVEEMHQISELATRGEHASRQVEQARAQLENLHAETSVLGVGSTSSTLSPINNEQASQLLQIFRRELADAVGSLRRQDLTSLREDVDALKAHCISSLRRQDLTSLQEDVDALKVQLRRAEGGSKQASIMDDASEERIRLLSSDVTALRGTLAETATLLRTELCQLADQASQSNHRGMPEVTRQDLEAAMQQLRREMTVSMSALESSKEPSAHSGSLAIGSVEGSGARSRSMEQLSIAVSDLSAGLEKARGDALAARQGLDSLQEDLALLQTSKIVTQQELGKTTEFLSKEFRVMLDMTIHNFHSTSRQELVQASSQLRQELLVAIEEVRGRLPIASPLSIGGSNSSGPCAGPSPSSNRPLSSSLGRGELLDTEKDFGNLRSDLDSLKTRQEFLKQELKCLVATHKS